MPANNFSSNSSGDKLLSSCYVKPDRQDFTENILEQLGVAENATHISYEGETCYGAIWSGNMWWVIARTI